MNTIEKLFFDYALGDTASVDQTIANDPSMVNQMLDYIMCSGNDLYSSLREIITVSQAGFEHDPTVHGRDGFSDDEPYIEAKSETPQGIHKKPMLGTGYFSSLRLESDVDNLLNKDPYMLQSGFANGRLVYNVGFRLIDTAAGQRLKGYATGSTKTTPRYLISDWISAPKTVFYANKTLMNQHCTKTLRDALLQAKPLTSPLFILS